MYSADSRPKRGGFCASLYRSYSILTEPSEEITSLCSLSNPSRHVCFRTFTVFSTIWVPLVKAAERQTSLLNTIERDSWGIFPESFHIAEVDGAPAVRVGFSFAESDVYA